MPAMRQLDPETSHHVAVFLASLGLLPKDTTRDPKVLHSVVWGKHFSNPVGLAAGFDKDAQTMKGMQSLGFGFVEVGSITPKPQPGNPKPRVFRLIHDEAIINRYGFNSDGIDIVKNRLHSFRYPNGKHNDWYTEPNTPIVGINLGKNKVTQNAIDDYVIGVSTLGSYADYLVVNVSSPNTPGLRDLQQQTELTELLSSVIQERNKLKEHRPPVLVKISPDITEQQKKDIAKVARNVGVDGIIVSNTTISRPDSLARPATKEEGGLSGKPLQNKSTRLLAEMFCLLDDRSIPLIGVGGISNGQDAYDKIKAGASLVQLYTAMVYKGPGVVGEIKKELAELLKKDGYASVSEAVGVSAKCFAQGQQCPH